MTADINFTKGDGYPDIIVIKWTGDEGGREQYTRRFIADSDTSIGTESVSRAKQQAVATDGRNARRSPTGQARPVDGNGTAGNVQNDNRGSSASQLADIGRELIIDGKSFNTAGLRAILTMVCRALPALSRHSIPLR
jgi:hypothetical protein